jgi:catechol 2,3-dioxygenase-like lactoylglutathione lyase family enzyme
MSIELDHVMVPASDQRAAARRLGELLGVPWAPSGVGPFSPVYVSDALTLDFIDTPGPLPVEHYCFRVSDADFDAILARVRAAGIPCRGSPHGPFDGEVGHLSGGRMMYWSEPDGHNWEMLTVSYARAPRDAAR